MDEWARYCSTARAAPPDAVVRFRRAR
jgi:hypothetical protein